MRKDLAGPCRSCSRTLQERLCTCSRSTSCDSWHRVLCSLALWCFSGSHLRPNTVSRFSCILAQILLADLSQRSPKSLRSSTPGGGVGAAPRPTALEGPEAAARLSPAGLVAAAAVWLEASTWWQRERAGVRRGRASVTPKHAHAPPAPRSTAAAPCLRDPWAAAGRAAPCLQGCARHRGPGGQSEATRLCRKT